jgi:hypothetical protein
VQPERAHAPGRRGTPSGPGDPRPRSLTAADAVEIKVTVGDDQVHRALAALRLDPDAPDRHRRIGFVEDLGPGGGALPLLDAGVILRVRENKGDDDDSTVKLRPVDRVQLRGGWRDSPDLRIEADWAGSRHVLAASFEVHRREGRIASVWAGEEEVDRLFDRDQERFLAECATVPVGLDALTLLAPISAARWDKVTVRGVEARAVAERWLVGDLDFLELSLRADDEASAAALQADLERAVAALGIDVPAEQETKTRRVLAYLARRA